jgi:hypothetical protein
MLERMPDATPWPWALFGMICTVAALASTLLLAMFVAQLLDRDR